MFVGIIAVPPFLGFVRGFDGFADEFGGICLGFVHKFHRLSELSGQYQIAEERFFSRSRSSERRLAMAEERSLRILPHFGQYF